VLSADDFPAFVSCGNILKRIAWFSKLKQNWMLYAYAVGSTITVPHGVRFALEATLQKPCTLFSPQANALTQKIRL